MHDTSAWRAVRGTPLNFDVFEELTELFPHAAGDPFFDVHQLVSVDKQSPNLVIHVDTSRTTEWGKSFKFQHHVNAHVHGAALAALRKQASALDVARLLALANKPSGAFLSAVPNPNLGLCIIIWRRVPPKAFRFSLRHRLGLPMYPQAECKFCGVLNVATFRQTDFGSTWNSF